MTSKPLRVGVVGCGYWGPNLVRNFASSRAFEVAWVCDRERGRVDELARTHRVGGTTTEPNEVFNDPTVDAVAIATPIGSHRALAEAALAKGKHVWIEKPLAGTLADAVAIEEAAKRAGKNVFVDHTFVYTPAVRKIRELFASGSLGDALYFDSVRVNLGLFQSDSNVLWDLGPHDLSIAQFVLARRPEAVSAIGVAHVAGAQENIAYVTLRYNDTLVAHFHMNWLAPVKVRRITVGGTKKMVVFDDLEVVEKIRVYDKGIDIATSEIEKRRGALVSYRSGDMFSPRIDQTEALRNAVEEFASSIIEKRQPLTGAAEGVDIVRTLAAAQTSLERGGGFVKLDEVPR